MHETIEVSACCKAEVVEGFDDNPRDHHDPLEVYKCTQCKRTCELTEVCSDCLGTGEISVDEDDGEGHTMRGVGWQKCHCKNIIHED